MAAAGAANTDRRATRLQSILSIISQFILPCRASRRRSGNDNALRALMNTAPITPVRTPLSLLKRLAKRDEERCDFCNQTLAPAHRHLLEVATRKMICACDACAMRFENVIGRFKLIPRDARRVPNFQLSDPQWDALALPINLAFIFHSTQFERAVALYPSPAGATESLLPLDNWKEILAENPVLAGMAPDVECLLVNRLENARDYFIAPIDLCYELAGLIRLHWRGLSGGEKVWQEVRAFFARLDGQPQSCSPRTAEAIHA